MNAITIQTAPRLRSAVLSLIPPRGLARGLLSAFLIMAPIYGAAGWYTWNVLAGIDAAERAAEEPR